MQPTHSSMLRRTSAGTSPRTTTSDTAKRPPGLSTRNASRRTASLSLERLMTQFEMITSTELSGSGNRLDRALEELDIGRARLALVLPRQRQHLVGHVEAVGLAGRADPLRGQQHVDAAAGTEVEHGLAGLERQQRGGIAAAERRGDGVGGKTAGFGVGIEVRGDRIAAAARGWAAAAGLLTPVRDRRGDGAVFSADRLLDVSHVHGPLYPCKRIYGLYAARDIFVNTNIWHKKMADLETLFQALGDATRLRILGLLLTGEVCVCDIHETLKIPQPKASRHLAYLRRSGLVDTRREGLWIHYRLAQLADPIVNAIASAVQHALTHVDVVQQRCDPTAKANRLLSAVAGCRGWTLVLRAEKPWPRRSLNRRTRPTLRRCSRY